MIALAFKRLTSILLALIISKLVSSALPKTSILHGPNSNHIRNSVYQYGGQSYCFKPKVCICPTGILRK